tara:strand:+ start:2649 stop:3767 length:1119 start_codon:yes stop_codon:yes gene_type:complete
MGKCEVRNDIPTAGTNGIDVMYNEEYVNGLSDPELRFLVMHETTHKARKDFLLYRKLSKINHKVLNIAMDYLINHPLVKLGEKTNGWLKMPKGGFYKPEFNPDTWTTEQLFYHLLDNPDDMPEPQEGDGDGEGDDGDRGVGGLDYHDWDSAESLDAEEIEELADQIDQAINEGIKATGSMGGKVSKHFKGLTEVFVDWKEVQREHVASTTLGDDESNWWKPNRMLLPVGLYRPTYQSDSAGELAYCIDVSGSYYSKISECLSELVSMLNGVHVDKLHLIYWDSKVERHEIYDRSNFHTILDSTAPYGGGGTDPQCCIDYMEENRMKPDSVVVLTDGYVNSWGDGWSKPPLWIIDGSKESPTIGKTVYKKEGY